MRKMQKNGQTLKVVEHIMLTNFWEYYVTTNKYNEEIIQCLVLGAVTELGDVYLPEIEPYIMSRTKNLNEVLPAPGYQWVD